MNLFSGLEIKDEHRNSRLDLPDAEIYFYEDFFDERESKSLFDSLLLNVNWRQDKIKIFNKEVSIPRLSAWYGNAGLSYSYSGLKLEPNEWNEELLIIKEKIENHLGIQFNSVLINLYRDGQDSMGWHKDDEKELGINPIIVSVSLGQERPFQLKHMHNKGLGTKTIKLSNGSLLLMQGTTQHFWKHQIPKTVRQINPRINLTFRIIKGNF